MFGKQKKKKMEERRKPENAVMRREFNAAQKSDTSAALRVAQIQTKDLDSRIENLRRIARLGALKDK